MPLLPSSTTSDRVYTSVTLTYSVGTLRVRAESVDVGLRGRYVLDSTIDACEPELIGYSLGDGEGSIGQAREVLLLQELNQTSNKGRIDLSADERGGGEEGSSDETTHSRMS